MFLNQIVTQTLKDLEQRKKACSPSEMMLHAVAQPPPRDLLEALHTRRVVDTAIGGTVTSNQTQVHLIAEVKRASPSKGLLAPHFDPVALARIYAMHGATAISVLTEPHFFLGSLQHLRAIKEVVSIPVLRKDFIVDEYQVYESRAWGADAILLICAILNNEQLKHLLHVAHDQRMHCLVEVHSAEEARRAVAAGAQVIRAESSIHRTSTGKNAARRHALLLFTWR